MTASFLPDVETEIRHFHLFCGIGGGARGFNAGHARVGQLVARYRCVGGVDVSPAAVAAFERVARVRGTALDLFDVGQYRAFHGKEPPAGWREATAEDIRRAAGGERPHIVFTSPPCLPSDGLVLTPEGPRAIETIRAGDLVLTHKGRYRRAVRVGAHLHEGPLYGVRLNGTVDVQWYTGNHPILRRKVVRRAATGRRRALGQDALFVADPRIENTGEYGQLGVKGWEEPASAISGQALPGGGRYSVADPRVEWSPTAHRNKLRVTPWNEPAGSVIGTNRPQAGAPSVADPRVPQDARYFPGVYGVTPWGDSTTTVTGESTPNTGRFAVADPRLQNSKPAFNNVFRVVRWGDPSPAVTGPGGAGTGLCVADPRADGWGGRGKYRVTGFDEPAGVVIAASTTGNGAYAVADPRPATEYQREGPYGVLPWHGPARAVAGSAGHDNGPYSVADPRLYRNATSDEVEKLEGRLALPEPAQRLVAVIRALDGTWHRPFTTLELAALQSLVTPGEPLTLEGTSDSAWREWIGNAVPPDAAQAIGCEMGRALLLAWSGQTFALGATPIWVRPLVVAMAVDVPRLP